MKTALLVILICCMTPTLRAACAELTLEKQFAMSAVVFAGRAIDRTVVFDRKVAHEKEPRPNTLTTFAVEVVWKGNPEKTITIQTCGGVVGGGVEVICGESVNLKVGMQYLVFARGRPLATDSCLGTGLIEDSRPTLQWLAARRPIVERGTSVVR